MLPLYGAMMLCAVLSLRDVRAEHSVVLVAWCLMANHVHLVLRDDAGELSAAMHSVATAYASYFNLRTGHVGPVFAGRFKSVPVTSEAQLLAAVRYVHDNPAKAGVCSRNEYRWSSHHEYIGQSSVADTSVILDMLDGVSGFLRFVNDPEAAPYYPRISARIPDEDAKEAASAAIWPESLDGLKALPPEERATHLRRLGEAGLSIKQIGRLTGLGRYAIEKGLHQKCV